MSEKHQQAILIPEERVPILIGEKGEAKKQIERQSKCKLDISSEGEITITAPSAIDAWQCAEVVKAIGRGFSPDTAQKLFIDGYCYEQLDIHDYAGKSKKKVMRLKGRVIGEKGKAKHKLEGLTNTDISVYGKTVGIIGKTENAEVARKAVEMLLSGSMHSRVFKLVEEMMREQNE